MNKIEQAVSSKAIKLLALSDLLADFDKRFVDVDMAETEYEQELSKTDIADAIETAGEVRDKAILTKQTGVKQLSELKKMVSAEADHEARSDSASDKVRLLKLQLPKFSGDVLKSPQFWDSFSVTVDVCDMSDLTKLTYLRSSYWRGQQMCRRYGSVLRKLRWHMQDPGGEVWSRRADSVWTY